MAKRRKVRPGEAFVLRDGRTVETKAQLAAAVAAMGDDEFAHFCNEYKNDFYVWLRDCLDEELAEKVCTVHDRAAFVAALKGK